MAQDVRRLASGVGIAREGFMDYTLHNSGAHGAIVPVDEECLLPALSDGGTRHEAVAHASVGFDGLTQLLAEGDQSFLITFAYHF